MRIVRHHVSAAATAAALLLAAGCAGDEASGGSSSERPITVSGSGASWDDGDPVQGDVAVTWKNLNPANPAAAASLVNESSEVGQKLKSGKGTSSEIRVVTDAQMGGLLEQLTKLGFFDRATDGLGLDNMPDVPGRRGIVVVTQNGHSRGLMLTTNLGPGPIPQTYRDCKNVVLFAHSQVPGYDVKASLGAPDERTFSVPRPQMHRP